LILLGLVGAWAAAAYSQPEKQKQGRRALAEPVAPIQEPRSGTSRLGHSELMNL
jgi:hypothetical protein